MLFSSLNRSFLAVFRNYEKFENAADFSEKFDFDFVNTAFFDVRVNDEVSVVDLKAFFFECVADLSACYAAEKFAFVADFLADFDFACSKIDRAPSLHRNRKIGG